jgi:plastocyanin
MTRALIALPLLLVALAGCGSSSSSSSTTTSTSAPASSTAAPSGGASASGGSGSTKVTIKNLAFSPVTVNAKAGQTIQWVNQDTPPHNVTYVSGPKFTSSGTLNTGGTFKLKLTQPGTIHYFCSIHPFMKATVVVSK